MIIHQPYDNQLGVDLIAQLESEKYDSFTIMVAYAKLSGVYRLLPYMKAFKERQGKLRCIVGIDQNNTTYDALHQLNSIMNELYVFHSENFTQTFHVKCYWLSGEQDIWYAVGSNNLTAGGLFSNYEMSITNHATGNDYLISIEKLEKIYSNYSSDSSLCCQKVTDEFLDKLLENGYVSKELDVRKQMIQQRKEKRAEKSKKETLFGKEVFTAPTLPKEYQTKKPVSTNPTQPTTDSNSHQPNRVIIDSTDDLEKDYLIRFIPGAGNRSKQVHFTIDLLKNYFMLNPGDSILLQEMYPSGEVGTLEHRQIVFSDANSNVKIEIRGAGILDTNYPTDLEKRPVLVVKRVNSNLFSYMLLMDGNQGYSKINAYLKTLPKKRSLAYQVIDEDLMYGLWDTCPLM